MIRKRFNEFVKEHGHEPRYACATVKFLDDGNTMDANFKLSCDTDENDDFIFYYLNDVSDLESFIEEGVEDFVILPESVSFYDEI